MELNTGSEARLKKKTNAKKASAMKISGIIMLSYVSVKIITHTITAI
jgi:hypothetical protein